MRLVDFFKKVINYINEELQRDFLETMGIDQRGITEEAKMLYYYIDHYNEIQEKYGSFDKWEKSMKKQKILNKGDIKMEIKSNAVKEEIIDEKDDEVRKEIIEEDDDDEEEWTEEEEQLYKEKYGHLRKISILSKIPIEEWTKEELLNLIDEYELYCRIQTEVKKEKSLFFRSFISSGEYERMSIVEEYKIGE